MWYYSNSRYDGLTDLPFYLVGIGQHELQPFMDKPVGHPRDQFFYGTQGSGILKIGGKSAEIPPGSGFYIPAHVPHTYYPKEDVWDLRWVSCGGSGVRQLCQMTGIGAGKIYPVRDTGTLDAILNRMHTELVYDKGCGNLMASSFINQFILEFARQCGLMPAQQEPEAGADVYERSMAMIQDYVEYHFMNNISMQELCDLLLVSPQHLCRIVKRCTGKRPTEYINMVRIEKAKGMLVGSEETVETVALWCGFENCNYFCKIFKKLVSITPRQYRMLYASENTVRGGEH